MALEWHKIISFYEKQTTEQAKSLLLLLKELAKSDFIENLYYFNSHDTLCITLYETERWKEYPFFLTIKGRDSARIIIERIRFTQEDDIAIKETKSVSVSLAKSAKICMDMIEELRSEKG